MRPIVVQVGPLAATAATNIALSQTPAGEVYLVLNGALGAFSANGIALSQSITGASPVSLNGANSQTIPQTGATGAITAGYAQRIYITSAGNDSGITFAVTGLDRNGAAISETITGTNAGYAVSANAYYAVTSITTSGSTASTITVGYFGSATMDTPRQVLVTTSAAVSFTISGTNWAGSPISEIVTNSGASVASVLTYATVSSILVSGTTSGAAVTVGTNGVADSPWVRFDDWASSTMAFQCSAFGTVNYTLYSTEDDPNSPSNPVLPQNVTWIASSLATSQTSSTSGAATPGVWAKITLNSETAGAGNYVVATFDQFLSVPY